MRKVQEFDPVNSRAHTHPPEFVSTPRNTQLRTINLSAHKRVRLVMDSLLDNDDDRCLLLARKQREADKANRRGYLQLALGRLNTIIELVERNKRLEKHRLAPPETRKLLKAHIRNYRRLIALYLGKE